MLAPWQDENGFARTCWHDILMQEAARSARAAKELLCAALNDCREDFVTAQADSEASKKTPAAKEKAVAAVNEKFAEPLERLETLPLCWARWSVWPGQGNGRPSTTG